MIVEWVTLATILSIMWEKRGRSLLGYSKNQGERGRFGQDFIKKDENWWQFGTVLNLKPTMFIQNRGVGKKRRGNESSKCLAFTAKRMELLFIKMGKTMSRTNFGKESRAVFYATSGMPFKFNFKNNLHRTLRILPAFCGGSTCVSGGSCGQLLLILWMFANQNEKLSRPLNI